MQITSLHAAEATEMAALANSVPTEDTPSRTSRDFNMRHSRSLGPDSTLTGLVSAKQARTHLCQHVIVLHRDGVHRGRRQNRELVPARSVSSSVTPNNEQ
jgi:hypothetical protein